MIDLTPLEVRNKKGDFRRGFRGYDAELVNDFLDLVADRLEELVKENMALRDSLGTVKEELKEFRDKEAALSEALMAAQKLREDARRHAEKEGELLIREAKLQAEDARQEVARSLAHEEETLRQVRARRAQLVESFRRLLDKELTELEVIEETLELGKHGPLSRQRPEGVGTPSSVAVPSEDAADADAEGVDEADEAADAAVSAATPADGSGEAEEDAAAGDPETDEDEAEEDAQEDWLSSLVEESEERS